MAINQQIPLEGEELFKVLNEEYELLLLSAKHLHSDLSNETNPFTLLKTIDILLTRNNNTLLKAIGKDNKINRVMLNHLSRNVEVYFKTSFKQEEKKLCLVGQEFTPNENCVYSIHYERRHLFGSKGKITRTTYLNMKVQKTDFLDCDTWEQDFQIIYPKLQEAGWRRFTLGSSQRDTDSLWLPQHVMDVIFKYYDNPFITGTRHEFHNYIYWNKDSFELGLRCARYLDYLEHREKEYKSLKGAIDIILFFKKSMYDIDWSKEQSYTLKQKPSPPL